jgi:hypothetical protein
MRSRATWLALMALIVAGLGAGPASAGGSKGDARLAGRVLVCNAPGHCLERRFVVSAINSAGETVAKTTTHSPSNRYRLRLPPGTYDLLAESSGLDCQASATAVAHETTHKDITCLVP